MVRSFSLKDFLVSPLAQPYVQHCGLIDDHNNILVLYVSEGYGSGVTCNISTLRGEFYHVLIIGAAKANISFIDDLSQMKGEFPYIRTHIIADEDAHISYHVLYYKASLKHNAVIDLVGLRSSVNLYGLVLGSSESRYHIETEQRHYGALTTSNLLIKSVLDGRSSLHYSGMVIIDEQAHDARASQYNKNILCSPYARALAIPGLQAKTNRVQCRHGTATGPFSADMIWYGASRGISPEAMKQLLLQSFVREVVAQEHSVVVEQLLEDSSYKVHRE